VISGFVASVPDGVWRDLVVDDVGVMCWFGRSGSGWNKLFLISVRDM